jgi:hypothetical protein
MMARGLVTQENYFASWFFINDTGRHAAQQVVLPQGSSLTGDLLTHMAGEPEPWDLLAKPANSVVEDRFTGELKFILARHVNSSVRATPWLFLTRPARPDEIHLFRSRERFGIAPSDREDAIATLKVAQAAQRVSTHAWNPNHPCHRVIGKSRTGTRVVVTTGINAAVHEAYALRKCPPGEDITDMRLPSAFAVSSNLTYRLAGAVDLLSEDYEFRHRSP